MNYVLVTLATLSAIVLVGTAVSLYSLNRAHRLLTELKNPQQPAAEPTAVVELHRTVEALAAKVVEFQKAPPAASISLDPAIPRPGINLNTRSQALRMHRRGESLEQIAGSLQVPRQEVDLLLKVQRIVLSNI